MAERPYIGVTGPTTIEEVKHLIATFKRNGLSLETEHQPMIGFLLSYKTLSGQTTSNRRYSPLGRLPVLLEATDAYSFNTIHYNSNKMDDLGEQIKRIFKGQIYGDGLCYGLQLNIPWPPIDQLIAAKKSLPNLKIIMQLSHRSLEGKLLTEVAKLLVEYSEVVSYALIDPSRGRGKIFQPQDIIPYYLAIKDHLPDLTIGVAGGFTGENVTKRCGNIIDLTGTKDFSIDAEGGLRDKLTDEYGDDLYNPSKVASYIKEAAKFFTGRNDKYTV